MKEPQAQFVCPVCGDGFEQRSRFQRHLDASHPERAADAAILEQALRGLAFPVGRDALVHHAAGQEAPDEVLRVLEQLPDRVYRDAAEVGRAFGEVKTTARRGGDDLPETVEERGATAERTVSAAAVANLLAGVQLPANKPSLLRQARKNRGRVERPDEAMDVLHALPNRTFQDLTEVARAIGEVLTRS